jgi:hypothetical protein
MTFQVKNRGTRLLFLRLLLLLCLCLGWSWRFEAAEISLLRQGRWRFTGDSWSEAVAATDEEAEGGGATVCRQAASEDATNSAPFVNGGVAATVAFAFPLLLSFVTVFTPQLPVPCLTASAVSVMLTKVQAFSKDSNPLTLFECPRSFFFVAAWHWSKSSSKTPTR